MMQSAFFFALILVTSAATARADLKECSPEIQASALALFSEELIQKILAGDAASPIETLEVSGQQLKFFPPVAAFLKDVDAKVEGDSLKPAVTSCPGHHELAAGFPVLETANTSACAAVKKAYKEIFRETSICLEVQSPVEYFASLPVTEPSLTKMSDFDEIFKIYGPALARAGLLGAFRKQEHYDKISSVLTRMRAEPLRAKLGLRQEYLKLVNKDLSEGGNCLSGAPAELEKAKSLFTRAQTETAALRAEIKEKELAGLAEAKRDRARVESAGRHRPDLPFPALSDDDRTFLSTTMSAFLWRSRGGGIFHEPTNTNVRRATFTLQPMSAIAALNGGSKGRGLGTGLWGGLFRPWGKFHDMGRLGGDKVEDFESMKNRGVQQLAAVKTGMETYGFAVDDIEAAGPMMGYCYWYGWEKLEKTTMGVGLDNQRPYQHAIAGPTQWGEFCTGASFGYGMSRALLRGTK